MAALTKKSLHQGKRWVLDTYRVILPENKAMYKQKGSHNFFNSSPDIHLKILWSRRSLKTTIRTSEAWKSEEFFQNLRKQFIEAAINMGFTHGNQNCFIRPCRNVTRLPIICTCEWEKTFYWGVQKLQKKIFHKRQTQKTNRILLIQLHNSTMRPKLTILWLRVC